MDRIRGIQPNSRQNPTRQWLSIEASGWIFVCLSLVSVAWINNQLSGAVVIGARVVAGLTPTLAFWGIYRGCHRR